MNSKSKIKNAKSKTNVSSAVARKIFARARSEKIRSYIQKLLLELCRVNTTPNADVTKMRAAENRCFQILEKELRVLNFSDAQIERRPVNPAIQNHPHFSLLHFTKTAKNPNGLSPEETYAGRANLVFIAPGANQKSGGESIALNAHIDVVAPHFPPRKKGEIIFGRGACDDKGPLVAMMAALKILSEILPTAKLKLNRNVVAMFVVEEETGGNGSLSLATDRELKKFYDSVLVGEPTSLKIHPANRGAVWYRAELRGGEASAQPKMATRASPPQKISAFEMAAFVIEELEREGAAIRAESRHELFPQRPVQTCHGIIGSFGEHPSRICGEVKFKIEFDFGSRGRSPHQFDKLKKLVRDCLESGLQNYIGLYGDKTKVIDAATKKPMVARHYDFRRDGNGFAITVHGATGHMGAIRERDGAITKMAYLVRSLIFSKVKLEKIAGEMRLKLGEAGPKSKVQSPKSGSVPRDEVQTLDIGLETLDFLILEGGQGFLPTHEIDEVMARMRRAAERGAENCLRCCGRKESGTELVQVTFEKLHNAAFDGDPNSPTMQNAMTTAKSCKLWRNEPVAGWTVSCDARLFATEYPGMPVLTFGPGELAFAHSDSEQIDLEDIAKAVEFLALFLLCQTGTI